MGFEQNSFLFFSPSRSLRRRAKKKEKLCVQRPFFWTFFLAKKNFQCSYIKQPETSCNFQYQLKFRGKIKAIVITFKMSSECQSVWSWIICIVYCIWWVLRFESLQLRTEAKIFLKLNLKPYTRANHVKISNICGALSRPYLLTFLESIVFKSAQSKWNQSH